MKDVTGCYIVIGNLIVHSRSPEIHLLFIEQTGEDMSYEKVLEKRQDFAQTVTRFFCARQGSERNRTASSR